MLPDHDSPGDLPTADGLEVTLEGGVLRATFSRPETFNALTEPPVSRLLTLARSDRVIEIRANPMPQGGIVATVSDITERVRQAAALREMNETLEERVRNRTAALTAANDALGRARRDAEAANLGKTRFLAAAGHDILQPLNAARLYTSALQERFADLPGAEMAGRISSSRRFSTFHGSRRAGSSLGWRISNWSRSCAKWNPTCDRLLPSGVFR